TLLASNDDGGGNLNSLITYRATYTGLHFLDARAFGSSMTGTYTVSASVGTAPPPPPNGFSSTTGYGLVNAAAAVARGIGQSPFANVPNLGGNNWGNDMVNAPETWARGYTGQGITVAVIDSGVDINHSDLSGNIWRNTREIVGNGIDDDGNGYVDDIHGWNFGIGQNNNNVLPGTTTSAQGHGTHVAGTIAAMNNGFGATGVAYNARIMAIRLGDVNSSGYFTNGGNLASAIRYAVDNGARVINMSIGWSDSTALRDAMAYAASRNVITVSAAGNSALASPGTPAYYATQYGISVGAVDSNGTIASFSNRAGSNSAMVHVMAPGVGVYSTLPNNQYASWNGTSMASPHVAGVVALMLSANPNLTHAQIRQILTETSSNVLPRTSLATANSLIPSTQEISKTISSSPAISTTSSYEVSSVSELEHGFAQQEIVLKSETPTKSTITGSTHNAIFVSQKSDSQLASLDVKEQTRISHLPSYDELTGLELNYLLSSNDNVDLATLKLLAYS
ncbi:MAG: S8 family peptidase, partial [Snowella sp.]|nr:S8 family peptidase [Snowella sp.]